MDIKKQENLLSILLSSNDVFSRCVSILSPEYFDGEMARAVRFTLDYFEKYRTPPDITTVQAEVPVIVAQQQITTDKVKYACAEIETHCRQQAVAQAMWDSASDLETGDLGVILERMQKAVQVSLKRDLGWSFFDPDFLTRLDQALEGAKTVSTGILTLDKYLAGGLARQQVTLFTANSGAGKSIMLNNLAHNYALTGHHVVLLSLELPREMLFVRTAAITAGSDVRNLKEDRIEVSETVGRVGGGITGSLVMERIAGNSSANDIRSYLTHYELELGRKPDCVFVDYLDKMSPNQGMGKMNISEQDKYKSEQLAELVYDYNLICATASQQNREAIGNMAPRHDVIAGGLTKINTVDNVISLYMDEQMRLRGEMHAFFLKTRSADGVGKNGQLFFNSSNLRIHDPTSASNHGLFDISSRLKKNSEMFGSLVTELPGVAYDENKSDTVKDQSSLLTFMEDLDSD